MKKRVGIILAIILVITILLYNYKTYKNNTPLESVIIKENSIKKEKYAMYKENENGEYEEYNSDTFPLDTHKLNLEKSKCIDNRGEIINNVLKYENEKVIVDSNNTSYCYLYFDKQRYFLIENGVLKENFQRSYILSATQYSDYIEVITESTTNRAHYYTVFDITHYSKMYFDFRVNDASGDSAFLIGLADSIDSIFTDTNSFIIVYQSEYSKPRNTYVLNINEFTGSKVITLFKNATSVLNSGTSANFDIYNLWLEK